MRHAARALVAVLLVGSPRVAAAADAPRPAARPPRVLLTAAQTPVRDQGSRGTCSAFGAVAGLEAACKRAGLGDLDLSEEFLAYGGKLMWVEVRWPSAARLPADAPENALAASTGSTGTFLVEMLEGGFAVPTEADLPYRAGYAGTLDGHEDLADPWWRVAWNVDLWNLDPSRLPPATLAAPRFYRVADYRWVYLGRRETDPTYAAQLEEVLASGHEIVWDVAVREGERAPVWHHDPARPPRTAHAMLVVGYDRTSPDPRDHHFVVKNSWGPTAHPDGLTRVGYDYLRHGLAALWIAGVEAPAPWPEARFVGRWDLSLDGAPAVLAWNRVPGVLQRGLDETRALHPEDPALVDRRVGNLYPLATPRPLARVNGEVAGTTARLHFDPDGPLLRYDERRGRTADLRLHARSGATLSGTFTDAAGRRRPCYATRGPRRARPGAAAVARAGALRGAFELDVDGAPGRLRLHDDGTADLTLEAFGFARRVPWGEDPADPRGLVLASERPLGGTFTLRLGLLGAEPGVLVGTATVTEPDGRAATLGAVAGAVP